jgi:hypothetical protein
MKADKQNFEKAFRLKQERLQKILEFIVLVLFVAPGHGDVDLCGQRQKI